MLKRLFGRISLPKDSWQYLPAVLLFVYIVLRAKLLSINWDEAYSFFEFVRNPSWLPHRFNYMSANNHLLNTWLMKCSAGLFGQSELALRLPNVVAGGIFFVTVIHILRKFSSGWLFVLGGFGLVVLNPFLLDFFSMARGYGLSVMLLSASLLYLLKTVENNFSLRHALAAELLLVLAIAANLTLAYVLLPAVFLLVLFAWMRPVARNIKWLHTLYLLLLPGAVLALLAPYYQQLGRAGAFFYGSETKTLSDVFVSLAVPSAYGVQPLIRILAVLFSLLVLLPMLLLLLRIRNFRTDHRVRYTIVLVFLLLAVVVGPALQHLVLKTNLLSGRTAIFYLPMTGLALAAAASLFPKSGKIVLAFLGAGFFTHFALTANTRFFIDFREQADVKDAMLALKQEDPKITEKLFADVITTDLPYDLPISYYQMRFGLSQFGFVSRREEIAGCSWYYLPLAEAAKRSDLTILRTFPRTQTALLKGLVPPRQLKILVDAWQDFENDKPAPQIVRGKECFGQQCTQAGGAYPYTTYARLQELDTLTQTPALVSVSCRIRTLTRNTPALLVLRMLTAKGEDWRAMHVSALPVKPGEWSVTGWTRALPPGVKEVQLFLWNESKQPVFMDNVAMRLLKYE